MGWGVSRYEWTTANGESYWTVPGSLCAFDFRPLHEQAIVGGAGGVCIACLPDGTKTPAAWEPLGDGDWHDIKTNQRMRDLFPKRRGFTPTGTTLRELIYEAFTAGSVPDGSEFVRPLMPQANRILRVCGAGLQFDAAFKWGDAATSNIRDVIRSDFAKAMDAAQRGQLKDAQHPLRILDATCEKYGVANWKEFVPLELQKDVPGRLKHETTLTDNFNRSDNTDISTGGPYTWSELSGDWGIASNGLRTPNSGETQATFLARLDSDLSSVDHYAKIDVVAVTSNGGQFAGPVCRKDSTTTVTFYNARVTKANLTTTFAAAQLFKFVAGTPTQLGSDAAISKTATFNVLGRANGSTIECDVDAVNLISQTDTAITAGVRTGLRNSILSVNGALRFDNFEAADLAAPTGNRRRRVLIGAEA